MLTHTSTLTFIPTLTVGCAAPKYVKENKCEACPSGHTCDGKTATKCAATKYVKNNVCTDCPSGSVCNGAIACAKTKYVKSNA